MRRIAALWLMLAVCLCACAGAPDAGPSLAPRSQPPAPEHTLALFGDFSVSWYKPLRQAAEDWAGQEGWALICYDYAGAETTLELQLADLEREGGAEIAVLCGGGDQAWLDRWTGALADRGAAVLAVSHRFGLQAAPAAAGQIAPETGEALELAGQFLGGKRSVLLRDTLDDPVEEKAAQGLEEAGAHVLAETYTWGSVDYAQTMLASTLELYPAARSVLCFSRTGALGARAALEERGRGTTLLALGDTTLLWEELERGTLDALVAVDAHQAAQKLQESLTRLARGEKPGRVVLPVEVVTAQEAGEAEMGY